MNEAGDRIALGAYAARLLRQSIRDSEELLERAVEAAATRLPDSGVARIAEWLSAVPARASQVGTILDQNVDSVEVLLRSSRDQSMTIALALERDGEIIASLFVLIRSLGEAVMRVAYLLDSSVTPARSVARMAAFQLETVEGNLRGAAAFGPDGRTEARRVEPVVAELHEWLTAQGFVLHPDTRRRPHTASIELDGERENLRFDATSAFNKYLAASAWQWELGSGVTHGRGWMLTSIFPTSVNDAPSTPRDSLVGVTLMFFELTDALAKSLTSHTGVDIDAFLRRTHFRRLGMNKWTSSPSDLAVGHVEYGQRAPFFAPQPGVLGPSFRQSRRQG